MMYLLQGQHGCCPTTTNKNSSAFVSLFHTKRRRKKMRNKNNNININNNNNSNNNNKNIHRNFLNDTDADMDIDYDDNDCSRHPISFVHDNNKNHNNNCINAMNHSTPNTNNNTNNTITKPNTTSTTILFVTSYHDNADCLIHRRNDNNNNNQRKQQQQQQTNRIKLQQSSSSLLLSSSSLSSRSQPRNIFPPQMISLWISFFSRRMMHWMVVLVIILHVSSLIVETRNHSSHSVEAFVQQPLTTTRTTTTRTTPFHLVPTLRRTKTQNQQQESQQQQYFQKQMNNPTPQRRHHLHRQQQHIHILYGKRRNDPLSSSDTKQKQLQQLQNLNPAPPSESNNNNNNNTHTTIMNLDLLIKNNFEYFSNLLTGTPATTATVTNGNSNNNNDDVPLSWSNVVFPVVDVPPLSSSSSSSSTIVVPLSHSSDHSFVNTITTSTTPSTSLTTTTATTTTIGTSTNDGSTELVRVNVHPDRVTLQDSFYITMGFTTFFLFFISLITYSGVGMWRYYVAGGICAMVSHVVPVPLDVIKTQKQINPQYSSLSFLQITKEMMKQQNNQNNQKNGNGNGNGSSAYSVLLSGLGPTALGYLLEGAIKYGVYEVMKPFAYQFVTFLVHRFTYPTVSSSTSTASAAMLLLHDVGAAPTGMIKLVSFLISAALSGVAASIILCPMEALRIRMVAHPEQFQVRSTTSTTGTSATNNNNNSNWIWGSYQLIKKEGITSLSRGLVPMLLKQVPYTITKNVSFDIITKYFYSTCRSYGYLITPYLKIMVPFVAAIIASMLSCITSQPGDMLLSLANAHSSTITTPASTTSITTTTTPTIPTIVKVRTTRDIIMDIVRSEKGWKGFFVGMKTRLIHVGIIVTIQLVIYDFVKRFCGIAATGC